jgi:hypothetical protein
MTITASATIARFVTSESEVGTLKLILMDALGQKYEIDAKDVTIPFGQSNALTYQLQGQIPSTFNSGYFTGYIKLYTPGNILVDKVFKARVFIGFMDIEEFNSSLGDFSKRETGRSTCKGGCDVNIYGYLQSAVCINNGKLDISLPIEQIDKWGVYHGKNYINSGELDWRRGGSIQLNYKKRYGFFATKIKMDLSLGHANCNFWLYNESSTSPKSITMEMYQQNGIYKNNISIYNGGNNPTFNDKIQMGFSSSNYKILAIEWKNDRINWYIDNVLVKTKIINLNSNMRLRLDFWLSCEPWWTNNDNSCNISMPTYNKNWVSAEWIGW